MKKWLPLMLIPLGLSGCATSTITNLTPSQMPRSATGLYPIEMAWQSSQQTIRPQTIQPFVIVDFKSYEMRRTLGLNDRWETLVPIPAERDYLNYHFKVYYDFNQMGEPGQGSKLSDEFTLRINDSESAPAPEPAAESSAEAESEEPPATKPEN